MVNKNLNEKQPSKLQLQEKNLLNCITNLPFKGLVRAISSNCSVYTERFSSI